jgi:hypothetical protein
MARPRSASEIGSLPAIASFERGLGFRGHSNGRAIDPVAETGDWTHGGRTRSMPDVGGPRYRGSVPERLRAHREVESPAHRTRGCKRTLDPRPSMNCGGIDTGGGR